MAPGKGEDEGRHYPDKQTRYQLVCKHGNALVDGIPRSSPHRSIAYHPATTKRSQFGHGPGRFRVRRRARFFSGAASTRGPGGPATSGQGGWFERVLCHSPRAVARAVVAIGLSRAGAPADLRTPLRAANYSITWP